MKCRETHTRFFVKKIYYNLLENLLYISEIYYKNDILFFLKIGLEVLIPFLNVRMPWMGDKAIQIDRFDVRAHLDFIQEYKQEKGDKAKTTLDAEEVLNCHGVCVYC